MYIFILQYITIYILFLNRILKQKFNKKINFYIQRLSLYICIYIYIFIIIYKYIYIKYICIFVYYILYIVYCVLSYLKLAMIK